MTLEKFLFLGQALEFKAGFLVLLDLLSGARLFELFHDSS